MVVGWEALLYNSRPRKDELLVLCGLVFVSSGIQFTWAGRRFTIYRTWTKWTAKLVTTDTTPHQ